MFSVTLISAPGLLDASLLENLRNAWGGGDALWLAPDEAAEFSCAALPETAGRFGKICRVCRWI